MTTDDVRAPLACEEIGHGPPVLLVHGFPFSGAMWRPVAGMLAAHGWRVLLPDLRGFGASTGRPPETLGGHVEDLVALLDARGLGGHVTWVGFSMGGYIALEAWRRKHERIGRLGLVDTRAGADDEAAKAGRLATAQRVEREGSQVVADAMLPRLFADGADETLRRRYHAAMASARPEGVVAALRAMAARHDARDALPGIHVPCAVVVGSKDAITPPADAEAMARAIPSARLTVVAGAGHMAPVEAPELVAEALAMLLMR